MTNRVPAASGWALALAAIAFALIAQTNFLWPLIGTWLSPQLVWLLAFGGVVAAIAGLRWIRQDRRAAGLLITMLGADALFLFSLAAGFSIGNLTCLVPLLLTAAAVSSGLRPAWIATAFASACAVYALLVWILPYDHLVYFFGIHIQLALANVAFAVAITGRSGLMSQERSPASS